MEQKTITVSIEPLRYLTERITGNTYHVVTFVPKGSSPETYEPTPDQLVQLNKSDIFFSIGNLGFEQTWLNRLKKNAPNVIFNVTSEGIDLQKGCDRHHGSSCQHTTDPHVWTSPRNMKIMAENICATLCRTDSSNCSFFRFNLQQVLKDIQTTEDSIQQLTQGLSNRTFLIYHPTLTYFARDFNLKQISIENDGKEPSPSELVNLIALCKENKTRTVFVQQEFDKRNAELIAQETNTQIIRINPLSYNWHQEMLNIAYALQP